MTVILNIHEVKTSSTAELVRRRREFTEVSDHTLFGYQLLPCLIGAKFYLSIFPDKLTDITTILIKLNSQQDYLFLAVLVLLCVLLVLNLL